jgi:hypothetical protein
MYCGGAVLAIIGAALVSYRLRSVGEEPGSPDFALLARIACKSHRWNLGTLGYIEYEIKHLFLLDIPFDIHDPDETKVIPISIRVWTDELTPNKFSGLLLSEIQERYGVSKPSTAVIVSTAHGELIAKNKMTALKVCQVTSRTRKHNLIIGFPVQRQYHAWVQQLRATVEPRQLQIGCTSGVLALPRGTPENPQRGRRFGKEETMQFDGVHFLKALRFSRHIHAQEDFGEALDDAMDVGIHDDELRGQVQAAQGRMPKAYALKIGRLKLDAVTMGLERRELSELILEHPTDVISMHLHTDGSPVTGTEIQGMILEIILAGDPYEHRSIIMPGVCLFYGQYGLYSKVFAYLWSLFLLVGPWAYGM